MSQLIFYHNPIVLNLNWRCWAEEELVVEKEKKYTTLIIHWLAPLFDWTGASAEGKDIGKVLLLLSRSYVLNYDGYWSEVAYIIEWHLGP